MNRSAMALALLVGASAAGAQAPSASESARLIEVELLGGYTPVALESWAGRPTTASNLTSFGVNVRAYLIFIGKTRVGLEVGNQHFFTWEDKTQTGTTIFTTTHHVGGLGVALVARGCSRPRFDCDVGYGFHFLEEPVPGVHFGINYIVVESKRFKLPVGARVGLILGGQSVALPLSLKTGVTF